jgi:hypothetical protein
VSTRNCSIIIKLIKQILHEDVALIAWLEEQIFWFACRRDVTDIALRVDGFKDNLGDLLYRICTDCDMETERNSGIQTFAFLLVLKIWRS